jgi:16S rRNA U1498 N3-methylase RsmE
MKKIRGDGASPVGLQLLEEDYRYRMGPEGGLTSREEDTSRKLRERHVKSRTEIHRRSVCSLQLLEEDNRYRMGPEGGLKN